MEDYLLSKTCQICQANAPEKVKFYQHYGAVCCYSCKAFFRRYVRGENNLHMYQCKGTENCPLTEGRKTCKSCRYNKCLEVGMSPENVLNEEDRKKYTHPKKNRKRPAEGPQVSEGPSASSGVSNGVPDSQGVLVPFLTQEVQRIFSETIKEVSAESDSSAIQTLVSGHLNKDLWSTEHSMAFQEIMEDSTILMREFSAKLLLFSSLTSSDQNLLLTNNTKFFKEYLISRYLMANDGVNQLSWILGLKKTTVDFNTDEIDFVDFDTVNQQHGFLISHLDPNALETYKSDLQIMSKYFQYPIVHTSLICHYLLFSTRQWKSDDLEALQEKAKIQAIQDQANEMVVHASSQIGNETGIAFLEQLVDTLQTMISLKTRSSNLVASLVRSSQCTRQEMDWIDKMVELVDDCLQKYQPGNAELVDDIVLYHTGAVHLRHKVLFQITSLFHKRCLAFLEHGFGITGQLIPMQMIGLLCLVGGAKGDMMTTFGDYLRYCSGMSYLGHHESRVNTMPHRPWFKNRTFLKLVKRENLDDYERVVQSVGHFMRRKDIFALFMTNILLSALGTCQDLQQSVQNLLFKRIKDCCVLETKKSAEFIYGDFLSDVQTMGIFTQTLMSELLVDPSEMPKLEVKE